MVYIKMVKKFNYKTTANSKKVYNLLTSVVKEDGRFSVEFIWVNVQLILRFDNECL